MDLRSNILESQKDLIILEKDSNSVFTIAKFGPSKRTKIPLRLSKDLAFLIGAIIGDGHLRKSKYQIIIELTDKDLLQEIVNIFNNIFERTFNLREVKERPNKKKSWQIAVDGKSIFNLFNKVFEIPAGKKSHKVIVPNEIKKANKTIKSSFLKGILLTEGGKRKRAYGMSTASKELWVDLINLFNELTIRVLKDKWVHKTYKKEYYGLVISEKDFFSLTGRCRSGQTGDV
jgi:hypothetical protein